MELTYCDALQESAAGNGHAEKLANAIAWMGERYTLHPTNRIAKLKQPLMLERTMEPKVLKVKR